MDITGIGVSGSFYNKDGTTLTWDEFTEKLESVGLEYGGMSSLVNEEREPCKQQSKENLYE